MIEVETYREDAVAEKLGVSRVVLRALRRQELTPPEDFRMMGNAITYTESGIKKIAVTVAQWLDGRTGAGGGVAEALRAPDEQPEGIQIDMQPVQQTLLHLKVTKVFTAPAMSGRMLGQDEDGRVRLIFVRSNRNFRPGMMVDGLLQGEVVHFRGRLPRLPAHRPVPPR
jgi:hypothetical protein